MPWTPGKWAIRTRPRFIGDPGSPALSGGRVWVLTFPYTVNGVPRTEVCSTFHGARAVALIAHREGWPGA